MTGNLSKVFTVAWVNMPMMQHDHILVIHFVIHFMSKEIFNVLLAKIFLHSRQGSCRHCGYNACDILWSHIFLP